MVSVDFRLPLLTAAVGCKRMRSGVLFCPIFAYGQRQLLADLCLSPNGRSRPVAHCSAAPNHAFTKIGSVYETRGDSVAVIRPIMSGVYFLKSAISRVGSLYF